jgi:hypothetical protein
LYNAKLYNEFGQMPGSGTLTANETTYMRMDNFYTGIYSVIVTQNAKPVAKEKVVWIR